MRTSNPCLYVLVALVVACGGGSGGAETPGGSPTAPVDLSACTTHVFPYGINDAAYSEPLGRIVALSFNTVRLLDPVTLDGTVIMLPMMGDSMSLAPDGLSAAVSHDHALSLVDLAKQSVTATIPTSAGSGDVVLAANGFAYFVPRSPENADLHSVEIATQLDNGKDSTGPYYNDTFIKLHPSGTSIYGIAHATPSNLVRNDISAGVSMGASRNQLEQGDHPLCGDLWITPDGADIFTGCGTVYRSAPATIMNDMTYRTALEAVPNVDPQDVLFEALTFDPPHDRIYAVVGNQSNTIPDLWDLEGNLRTFSYQTLSLLGTKSLPCMAVESRKYDARGRYVLTPADGSKIFVITEQVPAGLSGVVVFDRE